MALPICRVFSLPLLDGEESKSGEMLALILSLDIHMCLQIIAAVKS